MSKLMLAVWQRICIIDVKGQCSHICELGIPAKVQQLSELYGIVHPHHYVYHCYCPCIVSCTYKLCLLSSLCFLNVRSPQNNSNLVIISCHKICTGCIQGTTLFLPLQKCYSSPKSFSFHHHLKSAYIEPITQQWNIGLERKLSR